jgi:hypothetical protein
MPTVGSFTLIGDVFDLGWKITWVSFFLKFYLEMDDDIKYLYSSILFLISLVGDFLELFRNFYGFFFDVSHFGITMNKKKHKYARNNMSNKFIWLFYLIIESIGFVSGILLIQFFIPFTQDNCHSYSQGLCIYGRIIAFFGVINIVLPVLYVIIRSLLYYCADETQKSEYMKNMKNKIIEKIPFIKLAYEIVELNSYECSICLEDGDESENNNFIKTDCGHYFHKECLEEWTTNNETCPACRANINVDAISNAVINTNDNANIDINIDINTDDDVDLNTLSENIV